MFLGVALDCHWHFREQFREVQGGSVEVLRIARRARGAVWGMEFRILSSSTRALIESVISYGLAVAGRHVNSELMGKVGTVFMNTAARKIRGTNTSARRETLYTPLDTRNIHNHYIIKTASMLD